MLLVPRTELVYTSLLVSQTRVLGMFDNLSERLSGVLRSLTGKSTLTENNIQEALSDVRRALLEADVALTVVKDFIERVRTKAVGEEVAKSLTPGQALIKLVQSELQSIMGSANEELNLKVTPPAVILLAGLQGAGKTTSVAKIAKMLKEQEKKSVLVVSADTYRPAAIQQLKTLSTDLGVNFFNSDESQVPIEIVRGALSEAERKFFDVLIVDTAGRLALDEQMMNEIQRLHAELNPVETLFVVDAMTGQDAAITAKAFDDVLPLTGVVLTKADGDARGGAALSVRHVTGKPIKFIGVGEKIDDFETFHPDRLANRILGMGDIVSLVEKASQDLDEEKIKEAEENLKKGTFSFDDYLMQIRQMKKMGGMEGVLSLLPGVGKVKEQMQNANVDEKLLSANEAIILSMTKKERQNPDIISGSRRKRISLGSGTEPQTINRLLKQFKMMSKAMKKMSKGGKMPKGQVPDELLNNLK